LTAGITEVILTTVQLSYWRSRKPMKTAISIPDDVFAAAEAAAQRTGMSRSQLFVTAVKMFLRKNGEKGVTERLNEVYADVQSRVDPALLRMQSVATETGEEW
jgi:hypothetical protein